MEEYITSNFTHPKILAELSNPNKRFIIAMNQGESCGFSQLTIGSTEPCLSHIPTPTMVELQRIYVGLAHHGSGLGKMLMDTAISVAKKEGFEWIWLGVYEENKRAKRFYEKLGFEKVGTHDFWVGSDLQIDEIYLRKVDP
jgi:ribosomal protein S18 acetylase RimI-like enzyme